MPSGADTIWQTPLAQLQNSNVFIEAFGIGSGFNTAQLQQVDATPTAVDFSDLANALNTSGLFPATLVSYSLSVTVDGNDLGQIANELTNPLPNNVSNFDLAFADINGIEDLLGERNEFSVTATIDLDGDLLTTGDQISLNSFEAMNIGSVSRETLGTQGNDLLLGSSLNDELNGAGGGDVILAGDGNDVVKINDTAFKAIRGGDGIDEINIFGDDLVLDFTGLEANSVKGIESIEFEGSGSTITIDEQNVQNFSDDVNSSFFNQGEQGIFIGGDSDDTVNLDNSSNSNGNWILDNARSTASTEYYNFVSNDSVLASVAVDDAVVVNVVA